MTDENDRAAAAIRVGISNYVGTAALALLAGAVALYTYIMQAYNPGIAFLSPFVLAIAVLVLSLIAGGKGADKTADAVASGNWSTGTGSGSFQLQSMLTVVGLVLLIAAAFLGARGTSQSEACLKTIKAELTLPNTTPDLLRYEVQKCSS